MSSRPALQEQSSRTHASDGKEPPISGHTTLPEPVGPLTETVVEALTARPGRRQVPKPSAIRAVHDPVADQDFQLALWMLYELHYRGFADVPDSLEWDPLVLAARRSLELPFERALRDRVTLPDPVPTTAPEVIRELMRMTIDGSEPELAAYLAREATAEQFQAYLAERAVYHLRESDAQSFLLGRLTGPAKTALAEILYDEFGGGRADRLHADLFARGLADLDLPTDIAAYLGDARAATLASVNVASLFNLHRRLRGAAAGHFAAFEATSSIPCRLIAEGAERLGLPDSVVDYYSEHVEADSVHEQVAMTDLCGALVTEQPDLAADVIFGAAACLTVDGLAGETLLKQLRDDPPSDDDRLAS